jgi:hypothetical protein
MSIFGWVVTLAIAAFMVLVSLVLLLSAIVLVPGAIYRAKISLSDLYRE